MGDFAWLRDFDKSLLMCMLITFLVGRDLYLSRPLALLVETLSVMKLFILSLGITQSPKGLDPFASLEDVRHPPGTLYALPPDLVR